MSTVVSKNVQIGADGTASNNFTAYQPSTPDGTLRIGNGNSGSVTDAIVLNSSGVVSFTNNPTLSGGTANGVAYLNGSKVLTSGSALTFDGSNLSTTGQVLLENNNYIGFKNTTGTYAASIFNDTSNYLNLYNSGNTGTIFYVNAAEQMRLTSTGLGIGTSSPSGKLHVAGGASNVNFYLSNNSYSSYYYQNTGGSSGVDFPASQAYIWSQGGSERARIDSAGNVGIGTTSPNTRLQVNSTANTASNNSAWDTTGATLTAVFSGTSAADAGASIAFNDQGNAGLAAIKGAREATSGNGYLSFLTRNGNGGQYATERMRITSAGNVGIGTSSPSEVLEVYGTTPIIQINDRGLYQAQIGLIGNDLEIRGSSGSVEFYTGSADGASSTERARIDSSGHLIVPNGITLGTAVGTYADANTLDDYEEGTFTVFARDEDNNAQTYYESPGQYNRGHYVKIGQYVYFTIQMYTSGSGSTVGTQAVKITGLPFTAATVGGNGNVGSCTFPYFSDSSGGVGVFVGSVTEGGTSIYIQKTDTNGVTSAATITNWSTPRLSAVGRVQSVRQHTPLTIILDNQGL
jgi:hypothetical protein